MNNQIQSALSYLDAFDRDLWVKAAMAIKSELGEAGFYLWNDWSATADNYKAADALAVWRGIKPLGGIGIGSLFHEAKSNGWQYEGEYKALSPLELMQVRAQRQAELLKEQAKTEAKQKQVAEKARTLWHGATFANPEYPYLKNKGIPPYSLRQLRAGLLVPLSANREIVNLQFIQSDGTKRFLKNGQTKGAYCAIAGNVESIYLCEGWATGATIHHLTGCAVACAMSAGNLLHAGLALRQIQPMAKLIIAADNDTTSKDNTGLKAAEYAAKQLNAHLVKPTFDVGEIGSDFNDRYLLDIAKEGSHAS